MTNWNKNGGSAFPNPSLADESYRAQPGDMGMTLRDWFAGQALGSIPLRHWDDKKNTGDQIIAMWAKAAYATADAMLSARGADQ